MVFLEEERRQVTDGLTSNVHTKFFWVIDIPKQHNSLERDGLLDAADGEVHHFSQLSLVPVVWQVAEIEASMRLWQSCCILLALEANLGLRRMPIAEASGRKDGAAREKAHEPL